MPSVIVDGQNVFEVAEACIEAIDRARAGDGPTFIEAKTLRFNEHDIGTPDLSGWEERSEAEHAEMRAREPVGIATSIALEEGWLTEADIEAIREAALSEIAAVEAFADESEIARPSVESLMEGVFAK
jgi:pyruvate dehydrogenase E1 component alpha subunit